MTALDYVPPELWLQIFRWATISHRVLEHTATYTPFQVAPSDSRESSLIVKTTLALVCRQWRHLTAEFLYTDLRIRHGAQALKDTLDRDESCRRWVRRVVLPYPSTVTGPSPSHSPVSMEVLKLCEHIEALVRPRFVLPENLRFEFDAEIIPLPSLTRLEWWHHNEAERSGGINSLSAVLQNAPNLQFLFVGGFTGLSRSGLHSERISLPALRTLRLRIVNGLLLHHIICRWALPSLSHVIVDSPLVESGLHGIWETFGDQLHTVEFGKHLRFLMNDNLTPCLQSCKQLREINYFLFFTAPPELADRHMALTEVGLHSSVNSFLTDGESVWKLIDQHFQAFTAGMFPSLRRIKLYGEWRGIVSHPRFAPLRQRLQDLNCVIESASDVKVLS